MYLYSFECILEISIITFTQLKSNEGRADCAQPIVWAAKMKKVVDMFVIFTDQPYSSAAADDNVVTPVKALHQYCDAMSRPNTRYDV